MRLTVLGSGTCIPSPLRNAPGYLLEINRRHLLLEYMQDNQDAKLVGTEIHFPEAVEEKISLSDRFGLWLSFYPIDQDEYLAIVDSYFPNFGGDRTALHEAAKQFALLRGGRSGRAAKQFFNEFYKPET